MDFGQWQELLSTQQHIPQGVVSFHGIHVLQGSAVVCNSVLGLPGHCSGVILLQSRHWSVVKPRQNQ